MPLVQMDERHRRRAQGAQPLLVFSDDGRSMGLVVDEIVDIVEERLDIEVGRLRGRHSGLGGDQGPGDRDDRRRPLPAAGLRGLVPPQGDAAVAALATVLLVDDCAFFRNMLAPVLKAAGYEVRTAPNAQEGLAHCAAGQTLRRRPDRHRDARHERLRARRERSAPTTIWAQMPIIALSSMVSPAAIERGRQAGFHDYVAKFDRQGLIAALKEQTAERQRAA